MKVTIVGGWETDETKNQEWHLELDNEKKEALKQFCISLGKSLALKRHTVFVGNDDKEKSADYYVVKGMLEQLALQGGPDGSIRPIQGIAGNEALFTDEDDYRKYSRFFLPYAPPTKADWPRAAAKIVSVREADAVITIGGLTDTYIAGIAALAARKRLVPVGIFGGSSRDLLGAVKNLANVRSGDQWDRLYSGWPDDLLVKTVLDLSGLDQPRVFFGYSTLGKETAAIIIKYLEGLGLAVEDWSKDFESGEVILSEIQSAAHYCKYGVFLFTPDDTVTTGGETFKAPRPNVVFEAGYFMNSHGPKRTLIIVQQGTRVLSDYDGHIYVMAKDPLDISSIQAQVRKTFKEDLPEAAATGAVP